MKKFFFLLAFLLLAAVDAHGQQTVVTATVIGPNGSPYSFGTGAASIACPGNQQPTFNGSPLTRTIPITGIDGFGSFTLKLWDVLAIQPLGCAWTFAITDQCTIGSFRTGNIGGALQSPVITGPGPISLTTAINAFATNVTTCGGPGTPGAAAPPLSSFQYNLGGALAGAPFDFVTPNGFSNDASLFNADPYILVNGTSGGIAGGENFLLMQAGIRSDGKSILKLASVGQGGAYVYDGHAGNNAQIGVYSIAEIVGIGSGWGVSGWFIPADNPADTAAGQNLVGLAVSPDMRKTVGNSLSSVTSFVALSPMNDTGCPSSCAPLAETAATVHGLEIQDQMGVSTTEQAGIKIYAQTTPASGTKFSIKCDIGCGIASFADGTSTSALNTGILLVDGIKYTNLAAAVTACPSNGCIIFDTLPETFTADPFAGSSGKSILTQFGAGIWTVNYAPSAGSGGVNVKSTQRIVGTGRETGLPATGGTIIRAGSSLGANPVVKLDGTQGTRAENLTIDCNSIAGSTGLYATDINEQAGGYNLIILNCPVYGVNVDASVFSSIPAQNYTFRDLEIFPQNAGGATTVGFHMKGNGGGGPGEIRNITANGGSGHAIRSAIQVENFNLGAFYNLHGEFATNVFENFNNGVTGFIGDQITGSSTDTNIVNISASVNNFTLRNVATSGATNSIVDTPRSITLTDAFVGYYFVGPGALSQEDIISTSTTIAKKFGGGFAQVTRATSINTALGVSDGWLFVNASPVTITVPHLLTGQIWHLMNNNASAAITMVCDSGNINGIASVLVPAVSGRTVTADGTNCFAVGDTYGVASLTTTASASDNVTVPQATVSSHCSLAATNASAATNIATTYISAKNTNQVTVSHAATASMTYDIICTPN